MKQLVIYDPCDHISSDAYLRKFTILDLRDRSEIELRDWSVWRRSDIVLLNNEAGLNLLKSGERPHPDMLYVYSYFGEPQGNDLPVDSSIFAIDWDFVLTDTTKERKTWGAQGYDLWKRTITYLWSITGQVSMGGVRV